MSIGKRLGEHCLALAMTLLSPLCAHAANASPSDLAGLPGQLGGALGNLGGTLGQAGSVLGNLGGTLGQAGGVLGNLGSQIGPIAGVLGGSYIQPTPGTETFSGTLAYQGMARTWTGIRPTGAPAGAPVLILLHPRGTSPAHTANLTTIGRLAADYGAWIYLPESVYGDWSEDPAGLNLSDDVGFLAALVQVAITQDHVDAKHIYVAGYSNGGFMAERFACERSELVAGVAAVAATLHDAQRGNCTLSHPMPALLFDGTADPVVPYNGLPTLSSAPAAIAFFAQQSGCDLTATTTTDLPHRAASGATTAQLTRYTDCPAGARADLYTINGGGHTWPGAQYSVATLGATSQDVDATLVLWTTLIGYSLP